MKFSLGTIGRPQGLGYLIGLLLVLVLVAGNVTSEQISPVTLESDLLALTERVADLEIEMAATHNDIRLLSAIESALMAQLCYDEGILRMIVGAPEVTVEECINVTTEMAIQIFNGASLTAVPGNQK